MRQRMLDGAAGFETQWTGFQSFAEAVAHLIRTLDQQLSSQMTIRYFVHGEGGVERKPTEEELRILRPEQWVQGELWSSRGAVLRALKCLYSPEHPEARAAGGCKLVPHRGEFLILKVYGAAVTEIEVHRFVGALP